MMKTKQYLFNQQEVIMLREACVELYHEFRRQKASEQANAKILKALAEQFKEDVRLWRD